MRKLFSVFICILLCLNFSVKIFADSPMSKEDSSENSFVLEENYPYDDSDLNIITNIVNGEVGGICGTVTITYYDGSVVKEDACILHKIHAQIVDNQVNSSLFPSTVYGCAKQCWSSAYAKTGTRSSNQWIHCKSDVIDALTGDDRIPSNVFAATCDSRFAEKYSGFCLYAKVEWNTGWVRGTFYYYSYGYIENKNEDICNTQEFDEVEEICIKKIDCLISPFFIKLNRHNILHGLE